MCSGMEVLLLLCSSESGFEIFIFVNTSSLMVDDKLDLDVRVWKNFWMKNLAL